MKDYQQMIDQFNDNWYNQRLNASIAIIENPLVKSALTKRAETTLSDTHSFKAAFKDILSSKMFQTADKRSLSL